MTSINNMRGRITPTPPLPYPGSGAAVPAYTYPGSKPRQTLPGIQRPLTREQLIQGQAVLDKINNLPHFLRDQFISRHTFLLANKGLHAANKWLIFVFEQRIWPRLHVVNTKNFMDTKYLREFSLEPEDYDKLPGLHDKELRRLARQIADELRVFFNHYCDQCIANNQGDRSILLEPGTQRRVFGKLGRFAHAFHVTPMHWRKYLKGRLDIASAIASLSRLVDPEWWERKLKAQRTRWREALLIAVGNVSRDMSASSYASKQAIREVFARRQSNLEYLKSCQLENIETGERIDLIDKVMASISNPEIRRMELMNTIAFTEKYAAGQKHVGMFLTITTPSKYHPTRVVGKGDNEKVQLNHKWNDEAYSPKDGQRYLCKIWSKMRTAFKDNELSVYGMRVVEPHHDGTPHWHMMLFCQRRQRQQVIDIMRRYALKEDGDERGAAKYRFECKHMNKGGAAGYIAKYIAKNIDGYALEGERDHETGELLTDSAAAVTAWAATWRIPQFRPIGLPSMGVYRECRRIRSISLAETFDETVEAVRHAADEGDFAAYIMAQGGTNCGNQTVRLAKRVADELNAYDEEVQKVVGIYAPHLGADHIHETRTTQWRIVAGAVDVELLTLKSASGAPRSSVNNSPVEQKIVEPEEAIDRTLEEKIIDFTAITDAERRALLRRIKNAPVPTIKNNPLTPAEELSRQVSAEKAAKRQVKTAQLAPVATKIRDFAESIGLSISKQQAQSLACGATLTIGDQNWRAREDCCLYQCQPTTAQRVFSVISRVAKLREGVNRESHQY